MPGFYPKAESVSANTHVVENVAKPLEDFNVFTNDKTLKEAVIREGGEWAVAEISDFGDECGNVDSLNVGMQANKNKPTFESHDRYGNRIDFIEYHPSYHQLMGSSLKNGLGANVWAKSKSGAHVVRAAKYFMQSQVETGHLCPITMTFASIPTISKQPELAEFWLPKIQSTYYDPRNVPYYEKESLTIGMAMTEKQGGSDVRRNTTRAYPINAKGPGKAYELVGHKYFLSAPMCDAFLVLAQTEPGISCFLVPRWRPDGSKNPLQILRLKDKMGNVSNASSETELRGAFGWLVGEEGRGVANILKMVSSTRFDCITGSAGSMRAHMTQIVHHCSHRQVFGNRLDKQPLMQNVLADLALECEAATVLAMRMARSMDEAETDEQANLFSRVATAVGKYWVCKRTPEHAYEAMEVIGGSGVMENSVMPRYYRDAPVNSIWEGSGNVQCLDVLRAIKQSPKVLDAFTAEIEKARGMDKRFDAYLDKTLNEFTNQSDIEYRSRHIVEQMALCLQGALLITTDNTATIDAFCAGRLSSNSGFVYGNLPKGIDVEQLIDRCRIKT